LEATLGGAFWMYRGILQCVKNTSSHMWSAFVQGYLAHGKFCHKCKTFLKSMWSLHIAKMGIEIFTCSGSWCHSVIKCNLERTLSFQINYAWDLIHSTMQGWEMLNTFLTSFVWAWLFVPCIILQYFMLVLSSKIIKKNYLCASYVFHTNSEPTTSQKRKVNFFS